MTSIDGLIFTLIFIGLLCVITSMLALRHYIKKVKVMTNTDDRQDDVYDEIRSKILELNEYGQYLKSELDGKHKELLFLYQMINEKDKELRNRDAQVEKVAFSQATIENKEEISAQEFTQETMEEYKKMHYNKKILDLSIDGYSNQEIAKHLNIGTGQVELVLNLFK